MQGPAKSKPNATPAAKSGKTATPKAASKISAAKPAPPKKAAPRAITKPAANKGKEQTPVKDEINNLKGKAAEQARCAAARGKDKAAEAVGGIGKLIRDSAGTVDDSVGKQYGDYMRSAADAVEDFAEKVDAKKVDDIVSDARDFVRKSPAIAIGAAAAVGFLISRLVRSGRDDA